MWKQKKNATNLLTLVLILASELLNTDGALSDKRLCADEKCTKIISLGTGKINYPAGEEGMVSFRINNPIRIMSKSAGNNKDLWGVVVGGRQGYAPKEYIRENKIYVSDKDLKFEVNVEQKKPTNSLSASENLLDQETTAETTTTKPLNRTSVEPIKNSMINNTNEEFKTESSPAITPVQPEVVKGTKITTVDNDLDVKNEDKITVYDEKWDEYLQEEQKEPNNNINNVVKESVEKATDTSTQVKGDTEKNTDILADQRKIVKSADVKEMTIAKVEESESSDTKEGVPTTESHQNKFAGPVTPITAKEIMVNVNAAEETGTTFNKVNQNSVQEDEVISENSTKNSPENTENERDNDPVISDSTESSTDVNKENSKIIKDLQDSKAQQSEEKSDNSEFFSTTANVETKSSAIKTIPKNSEQNLGENGKPFSEGDITQEFTQNNNSTHNSTYNSNEDERNQDPQQQQPNLEDTSIEIEEIHVSQSEEISAATSTTPGEVISGEESNEESLAEMVVKSNSGSNSDKKAKESNEKLMYEANSAKKVTTSNTNKNSDKKAEETNDNPSQSGKHMETGTKEKSMYEENSTDPSQSVSDSGSYTPDEVLSGKSTFVHNNYQKDLASENKRFSSNTEEKETASNEQTDFSETSNYNSKHNNNSDKSIETPSLPSKINHHKDDSVKVPINSEFEITQNSDDKLKTPQANEEMLSKEINIGIPSNTAPPTQIDYTYQGPEIATTPTNDNHGQYYSEVIQDNKNSLEKQTSESYNNIPTISKDANSQTVSPKEDSKPLQSSTTFKDLEQKENKGLFATIMDTVNNMLPASKKTKQNEFDANSELDKILFSMKNDIHDAEKLNEENSFQYCKNIGPNGDCPETDENHASSKSPFHQMSGVTDLTLDTFLQSLATKILEMSELLAFLVIVAAATLFFVFGYYCFCNSSREGALLLKLNQLESSLLASHKENAILKYNLMSTRQKLTSIEDNSFGSNDMVVSLKKELEEELMEKARLQEQITVLQKELENAADAGIELNKIVSELLSNQTGDESIISSVEELQKQLNEQQNTIFEINASLAEKSRENSELQLLLAEQSARYETELSNVQRDNDELEQEKGNLITRLDEMKNDFDKDISAALEGKNMEIKRLQNEIVDFTNKLENEHTKWQTSMAKIEALEECLKNFRKDPSVNITEVINVANVKAQLIEIQKKHSSLKEKCETESDSRKLAESQLEVVSAEVEQLKQDFNQSEKDKLEAQTRLEVLSNYFKDKENQLQKELSVKEAMWLKQQGETTTTVDRLTAMQEEIQSLKSLNDSLRAEIEAQVAAHKAQTGTLENRAHETWLAARQSDRRYEEARAEATALRRRLTALAGGNVNEVNKPLTGPAVLGDELTQAPSPIHMESPGSPMLGRMPPPPFLPPPFMGHPPPFIGMPPPPPFVPPGEMRPAPLGRIMSPPPQRSGRFSPQHLDYDDYLDYESNNSWHPHTYSPPPRTYRSLSPTDSRYNYGTERDLISTYDTETDFSPPPSPRESRRRADNSSDRIDSNAKISYGNTKKFNTSNKGALSSGSEKSFYTRARNEMKATKGNTGGGGKTFA